MLNLIKRNTPAISDCFVLETTDSKNGKNYYEISEKDGKILIKGDCKISQAMGYYTYLKKYCKVNYAHCGNTELNVTEAPLPTETTLHIIDQEKRAYLNYCTLSYSMRSWQWKEWEKEIDFMAMNGINMPLSVIGNEATIFYTLIDFGISEEKALSFIAGPSYYAWQMMTNLDSFMHITDRKYIYKRLELGRKIIDRQIELGMTPIQQGFAGHVPEFIKDIFPDSELQHLPTWCGFPGTCQFDPLDKNFAVFGKALLEKQKELFGAYHYYACDPFHENEPPTDGGVYLANVGKTISKMYTDFDKDATWVMQAWSLREEIVKAVDKDKLLILDLDGSKSELHKGFWGYSFICGTLHNFGDRNSLHGSAELLSENQYAVRKEKYPSEIGTGLFMEGFFQNPLYYDLAFHTIVQDKKVDLDSWLKDYAERRYGSEEDCLKKAVFALKDSCYNPKCIGRETSSIIAARPSTTHYHTAPNDHVELRYDNKVLFSAAAELLKAENATTDGYSFDICDILRQVLSNKAKEVYFAIMDSFRKNDKEAFEDNCSLFEKILLSVDRILSTRGELIFDTHINEAIANACCDEHRELFRQNEVALITIWGPYVNNELFDYAWKEWAGLIKDYYLPRWLLFFNELRASFGEDISHISDTEFHHNERNDYETTEFQQKLRDFEYSFTYSYKGTQRKSEDTIAVARELVEEFAEII